MDGRTKVRPVEGMLALGGPMAIGAVIGMPGALAGILHGAAVVPLVVAGVALTTFPALYIVSTLGGVAPSASEMILGGVRGARNGAVACIGLAAPAAFLVASSRTPGLSLALGMAILAVAAYAAVTAFWRALYAEEPSRSRRQDAAAMFVLWAVLAGAIGGRILFTHLAE
ncbi:MAG TPA: hypothetical protein VMV18_06315 [bacterium]|nr:hypothetical protein [bacterium]